MEKTTLLDSKIGMIGLPENDVYEEKTGIIYMKEIPLIFPFALLIIIVALMLSTAYGLAESTVQTKGASVSQYEWEEKAALWVCPFH